MVERHLKLLPSGNYTWALASQSAPLGKIDRKYSDLAKLKTHFSLLDDEKDEVDEVKIKYYNIWPTGPELLASVGIVIIFALLLKMG